MSTIMDMATGEALSWAVFWSGLGPATGSRSPCPLAQRRRSLARLPKARKGWRTAPRVGQSAGHQPARTTAAMLELDWGSAPRSR